jgi:predicted N-formylglutamate amidohydrolase
MREEGRESASGRNLLILCEHATNIIPRQLNRLGLGDDILLSHRAWDIGALAVAKALAKQCSAPLIASEISRLVIDLNRPLDAHDLIASGVAGVDIPGNVEVTEEQRQWRIHTFHNAFHQQVSEAIEQNRPDAIISIHSCHPYHPMTGAPRQWEIGIGHIGDHFGTTLLQNLRQTVTGMVGDNQPYGLSRTEDLTLWRHGMDRGIPAAMLEIRNDLISDENGQNYWAIKLASVIFQAMAQSETYKG